MKKNKISSTASNDAEWLVPRNIQARLAQQTNLLKIISIDVANKSLAIVCVEFQDISRELHELYVELITKISRPDFNVATATNYAVRLDAVCKHRIRIKSLSVADLLPGQKVSKVGIVDRSAALHKYITKMTTALHAEGWLTAATHLVIEYQMGPNRKSGDMQSQLIYHFLQYMPAANIHVVGPSLKNKLCGIGDEQSKHNWHIAKYQTLYSANKSHTRYLFLKWLRDHGQLDLLASIPKKNYSDVADAFCQSVCFVALSKRLDTSHFAT